MTQSRRRRSRRRSGRRSTRCTIATACRRCGPPASQSRVPAEASAGKRGACARGCDPGPSAADLTRSPLLLALLPSGKGRSCRHALVLVRPFKASVGRGRRPHDPQASLVSSHCSVSAHHSAYEYHEALVGRAAERVLSTDSPKHSSAPRRVRAKRQCSCLGDAVLTEGACLRVG